MTATERADAGAVLWSLTHLMARWSSTRIQSEIAREAGARIDPADIPAVYMLGLEGGGMRASELAARLHLSRPTASKQLTRLDRAGLIARGPDPRDGRATIVALSPEGAAVHEQLVRRGREMVAAALADWPEETASEFSVLLAAFVGRLGITGTASPAAAPADD